MNTDNDAISPDPVNTAGDQGSNKVISFLTRFAIPALLVIAALIVCASSLISPLLSDEQFLLSWLKDCRALSGTSGPGGFMSWPGFSPADSWGFATHSILFLLSILFGGSSFFFKFALFSAHAASAVLLFLICRRVSPQSILFPLISALLFSVYPLHFESVSWLGGFGTTLGTMFFLSAFWLYLRGRENQNWLHAGLVALLSLLSIASSKSVWPFCLTFSLYELSNCIFSAKKSEEKKKDPSMTFIACLLPLMIVGAYIAGTGGLSLQGLPDFRLQNVGRDLRTLFFPIDELNWKKYSVEYRFLYIMYGLMLLPALAGLALSREARRNFILALIFSLVLVIPAIGVVLVDSTLYGERFLYLGSVGICMLLGASLSAASMIAGRWRFAGAGAGLIICLLISIMFSRHSLNETAVSRNSGRLYKAMQKSMRILAEKSPVPLLLVRDLPANIAHCPDFSPRGPVAFDAQAGLLRSNPVPDGRLREQLLSQKNLEATLRWEPQLQSFLPLDLPKQSLPPTVWTPELICQRMQPAIEFYRNMRMDSAKKEIFLESNSESGPMMTLISFDLHPLAADYMYVDAAIEAPTSLAAPRIELQYQTRIHPDFEKRERYAYADATVNDGKRHRYLLSLRSNAWTTGGFPTVMTLGFPAGSRVHLFEMGLIEKSDSIATLTPLKENIADLSKKRYTPPYFNYPYSEELGFIPLADNASALECNYSVAHIAEAKGILAEISWPNRTIDDANSNHLSSACFKTVRQDGASGKLSIPLNGLPGAGVYSVRVIASSANGFYLGQFSDPICFQVPKLPASN